MFQLFGSLGSIRFGDLAQVTVVVDDKEPILSFFCDRWFHLTCYCY